jgi:hypothetical protein
VGHALPVVSSPEEVGGLVLCLGLSGILSLFCQNKLGDVSLCGWMLQNTLFAMDRMIEALIYDWRAFMYLYYLRLTNNTRGGGEP